MTSDKRRSSSDREKVLRSAIRRIELSKTRRGGGKITFAAVAREAGVSTALIHNHHPLVADLIRSKQHRTKAEKQSIERAVLHAERSKSKELRKENAALREQIAKLASINEVLSIELTDLKARLQTSNVRDLPKKSR